MLCVVSLSLINQTCTYSDVNYNYIVSEKTINYNCYTWSLDTVTEVISEIVHNVQQEGEVSHVVHVNFIWISGNGPQLILICILHTLTTMIKSGHYKFYIYRNCTMSWSKSSQQK